MPEAGVGTTIADTLAQAIATLQDAGCDAPRLDAELLLAQALGTSRERLLIDRRGPVDAAALTRFDALLARRATREPVAYILGRKAFRRIELKVDPRVLIPRPETELLVEVGVSLPEGARVVDVGTGSGAVALALKDERPDLEVWATEVDPGALEVAEANGRALGVQVRFVQADLLEGVEGPFDAVLANLPYVEEGAPLAPEISSYEPARALFAGPDGLAVITRLVGMVSGVPTVALEVGVGQAVPVGDLLRRAGFDEVELARDLAGHERVVVGRR